MENNIDSVLIALRRVIRATDLHSKRLSKTIGITAPQLLVLQSLLHKSPATSSQLASNVSVSQATMTTILDGLEKKCLIKRERSTEDRRKVYINITNEGKEAVKDSPQPLQENFVQEFQELRDWEQAQIISSLQRVAQMMDAHHIDASPVLDVGELDRVGDTNKSIAK